MAPLRRGEQWFEEGQSDKGCCGKFLSRPGRPLKLSLLWEEINLKLLLPPDHHQSLADGKRLEKRGKKGRLLKALSVAQYFVDFWFGLSFQWLFSFLFSFPSILSRLWLCHDLWSCNISHLSTCVIESVTKSTSFIQTRFWLRFSLAECFCQNIGSVHAKWRPQNATQPTHQRPFLLFRKQKIGVPLQGHFYWQPSCLKLGKKTLHGNSLHSRES